MKASPETLDEEEIIRRRQTRGGNVEEADAKESAKETIL